MQALISGRSGIAVLHEAGRWFALQAHAPDDAVACHPAFRNRLLEGARDLIVLDDTDFAAAGRQLKQEHLVAQALDSFLFLCDAELPDSVREDAAGELLPILNDVERRLASILFARPLPVPADVEGAFKICERFVDETLLVFLHSVVSSQPHIREVFEAWSGIPDTTFIGEGTRQQAQALFVRVGLFYDLVGAARDKYRAGEFFVNALSLPEIRVFPNHRIILRNWMRPLQERLRANTATVFESPVGQEVEEVHPQNAKQKARPIFEIKQRIDKQKEGILEAVGLGKIDRAKDFVEDLIRFQLESGDLEFACKSLCDLAFHAQQLSRFDFQLWLTTKAIVIKPDDAWSWAQHGKALQNLNRLHEALESYDEAQSWTHNIVGKSGRAEVLKALNRLPEALAAYDLITAEYPTDVVSKNGRAEVLKALNRLPEALAAYDLITAEYPEDTVGKNGRAEVLKALNRLPEALAAYDAVIAEHPEDLFGRTGRAEVLKALNRLPEALAVYDSIIAEHPKQVVARTGRAEVLKALNRLPEALAAYDAVIAEYPEVVIGKNGRAELLKIHNRLPEALAAYDSIIAEHPADVFAKNGRTEVLKALSRLPEALAAYDSIIAEHPADVVAKNGRAEVLKALNRLPEALAAYDSIIAEHPADVFAKTGRAEMLKALNRLPEALAAYDSIIAEHPADVFAKTGRAEVLKALSRLPEALAAYNSIIAEHSANIVAKNGRAEVLKALNRLPEALAAYDAVIAEHPADVFAKTGRAEVLKALNRLSEALAAYDSIIAEYPANVVAKTGRAEVLKALNRLPEALATCENILREHPWDGYARNTIARILAMDGKLEQALAVLPTTSPVTPADWISYHIRGMILLRQGNLAEAEKVFGRGCEDNPRPADRDFFRSALAVTFLRQQKQKQAAQMLAKVKNPSLIVTAMILQVHALGIAGDQKRLSEIRRTFPVSVFPLIQPLRDEIDRRYLQHQPAERDDEWVFQREVDLLLAA